MAPQTTPIFHKFFDAIKKYVKSPKTDLSSLIDLGDLESLRTIFKYKYSRTTTANEHALKLFKWVKDPDYCWSIFFAMFEAGWKSEQMEKWALNHATVTETFTQEHIKEHVAEMKSYSLHVGETTKQIVDGLKTAGTGIDMAIIDLLMTILKDEYQQNDLAKNFHVFDSYSVMTESHRFRSMNRLPSFFFYEIPKDWEKVLFPIVIFASYYRWINVAFHPKDLNPEGPYHVLFAVATKSDKTLRIYDTNDHHNSDGTKNKDDKQYQEIANCIVEAFQVNLDVELKTSFHGSFLPGDKGDCSIFVMKAFKSELDGTVIPSTFVHQSRNAFRKYVFDKIVEFLPTKWDSYVSETV